MAASLWKQLPNAPPTCHKRCPKCKGGCPRPSSHVAEHRCGAGHYWPREA